MHRVICGFSSYMRRPVKKSFTYQLYRMRSCYLRQRRLSGYVLESLSVSQLHGLHKVMNWSDFDERSIFGWVEQC